MVRLEAGLTAFSGLSSLATWIMLSRCAGAIQLVCRLALFCSAESSSLALPEAPDAHETSDSLASDGLPAEEEFSSAELLAVLMDENGRGTSSSMFPEREDIKGNMP